MNNTALTQILSTIHTFEDYEKLKAGIEKGLARAVIHKHQLPEAPLTLFSEGTNIVFLYGDNKVIKIFPSFHQNQFESERLVLKHLDGQLSVKTPAIEYEGELFGWPYLVISKLEGTLLETLWEKMPHNNKVVILHELGELIREVHALPTDGLEAIDCHWPQFLQKQIANCIEQHQTKGLPTKLLQQLPAYLDSIQEVLPEIQSPVLLTGEYTPMNFFSKSSEWYLAYQWID